ncbi:acyl-CoA thioesterase [Mesobacterium pallidum]|uniref:acyl-CoA thioesterase n=1 Tax=Mesobacterium pallidum TaxID=2872037 RepID=UPI001EE1AA58|nr:thioesterase family protein [Mesobacterium pallidum]
MARPAPSPRTSYAWFTTLETRWADNDQYGHLNNTVHYGLFDTAVARLHVGWGVFDDAGATAKDVVVESGCIYHAEARYPDTIHVGLRVGHIGRSSWRYELGLYRNDEDTAFAEGFFAQVQTDPDGRPCALADAFRARLASLQLPG